MSMDGSEAALEVSSSAGPCPNTRNWLKATGLLFPRYVCDVRAA